MIELAVAVELTAETVCESCEQRGAHYRVRFSDGGTFTVCEDCLA